MYNSQRHKTSFSRIEMLERIIKRDGFFLSSVQPDEILKYVETIQSQLSSLELDEDIIKKRKPTVLSFASN